MAASGAAIFLNNTDANHLSYYGTTGNPAAGADFYVKILGGPDASNLHPVTTVGVGLPAIFSSGTGPNGPVFDAGFGIVPGIDSNAVGTFQVLAWKGAPTFDSASQRMASAVFTQATGASFPPDLPAPAMLDFPANLVIPAVPEPSTMALCLLGFAGLFATRWRT